MSLPPAKVAWFGYDCGAGDEFRTSKRGPVLVMRGDNIQWKIPNTRSCAASLHGEARRRLQMPVHSMPKTPTPPATLPAFNDDQAKLSRGERAYQKLLAAIQSGALKPGARLRENELAAWLSSSRTPVREALSRLQAEGLVMQEPRRGMIVTQLDHGMVAELYLMREVLEGTAARLAARHASEVEISLLREIAERDRNGGDDPVRAAKNNRLFHETLYRARTTATC